jgi:hypothetical protein
MTGRLRVMLTLLAALLVGGTLGYLLAGAAGGGGVQRGDEGFYDAYFDRGYHRGWQEGYDRGYGDGREDSPSSPDHALTSDEARAASDRVAVSAAVAVARSYRPSGLYEADAYDCNDMAEELWSAFREAGAASWLVVGNTRVENEDFADSDHCWVVVFCVDEATGEEITLAVDPQLSLVGAIEAPGKASTPGAEPASAGLTGGVSAQYAEGFFYGNPASLREDLGARW